MHRLKRAAALILSGALAAAPSLAAEPAPPPFDFVDAHVHKDETKPETSAALLVQSMDRLHETHVVVQILPYGASDPDAWDLEKVEASLKAYPGRLAFTGGGGTLNPMLAQAYASGDAGSDARRRLRERAEAILKQGASGFGELSNEHFVLPGGGVKDYEYYPADSPLMLLLADIAAEHDVPIDLHMEAVPRDMPSGLPAPNAPMLHANIKALEGLLAHNPRAKIIWAHVGSDNSGFRTPEAMRPLLKAHANLFMEIKVDPGAPGKNYPLAEDGKLKPEWLALFSDFPDRFIVGSDQHYDAASAASLTRTHAELAMLAQLPPEVRRRIAVENAERLYNLVR
jgi:hypothetical protein